VVPPAETPDEFTPALPPIVVPEPMPEPVTVLGTLDPPPTAEPLVPNPGVPCAFAPDPTAPPLPKPFTEPTWFVFVRLNEDPVPRAGAPPDTTTFPDVLG